VDPAQVHPLLKQFAAVGRVLTADIAIGHGSFGFAACCALLSLSLLFLSPLVPIYPTICFVFPNNAEREREM